MNCKDLKLNFYFLIKNYYRNLLGVIKRKNTNESVKKEDKVKRKKFDFELIKKEAMNICNTVKVK